MQESQILPVTCSLQSHNSPDSDHADLNDEDGVHDDAGDLNDEGDGGDVATCCLQTHNSHRNYNMLLIMMIKITIVCSFNKQ